MPRQTGHDVQRPAGNEQSKLLLPLAEQMGDRAQRENTEPEEQSGGTCFGNRLRDGGGEECDCEGNHGREGSDVAIALRVPPEKTPFRRVGTGLTNAT
jgi:hypothetical protein